MRKLLILLLFFLSSASYSGIWLEPYLGYHVGDLSYTLQNLPGILSVANGDYKLATKGPIFGGKIGYAFAPLAFGFQYDIGSIEQKVDSFPNGVTSSGELDEYDATNMGAFVTFRAIPLFNLSASYFFKTEWEDTNGSDKGSKLEGKGFGAGLGFTGLPIISLNLEFRSFTFDKYTDEDGDVTNYPSEYVSEYKAKQILFSVSAPFSL